LEERSALLPHRGKAHTASIAKLALAAIGCCALALYASSVGSQNTVLVSVESVKATSLVPRSGPAAGGQYVFVDLEGNDNELAALKTAASKEKTSQLAQDVKGDAGLHCLFHTSSGPVKRGAFYNKETGKFMCEAPPSEAMDMKVDVAHGSTILGSFPYAYTHQSHVDDESMMKINVKAVRDNAHHLLSNMPHGVQLCAVVKDQQPVGAISKAIVSAGHDGYIAVRGMFEARSIRSHGVWSPVLLMYDQDPTLASEMLFLGLEPAALSTEWIRAADRALAGSTRRLRVHLWIDTGMTREGVAPNEAAQVAMAIAMSQHLHLAGVATHFCCAGYADGSSHVDVYSDDHMRRQVQIFTDAIEELRAIEGMMDGVIVHAGASGVYARQLDYAYFDMLRIGRALFVDRRTGDGRLYVWETRVRAIKTLPEGWCVDYGCHHRLDRETRVAMLPGNDGQYILEYNGQEIPVLVDAGYMSTADVTDFPWITTGTVLTMRIDNVDHRHWLSAEPVGMTTFDQLSHTHTDDK